MLTYIILLKEKTNLEFVYGKRKSKLQKYAEGLEDFIEKQSKYDNYNEIFISKNFYSTVKKEGVIKMIKLIILITPFKLFFIKLIFNNPTI